MKSGDKQDSTRRFARRVENYIKYRPSYPPAVMGYLQAEIGFTPQQVVADIGSGTGILTGLFLRNGNAVYGVEPNQEMRAAGERQLAGQARFTSVAATAEATTLQDQSIDLVTAGQAFHWFDPAKARREFARILKPGGQVMLIWNSRKADNSPFADAYDQMLRIYGTDYKDVNHSDTTGERAVRAFFAPKTCALKIFANSQSFDFAGIRGRLMSSSYSPLEGEPRFEPMMKALREIFERTQVGGKVVVEYDTEVYTGRLG